MLFGAQIDPFPSATPGATSSDLVPIALAVTEFHFLLLFHTKLLVRGTPLALRLAVCDDAAAAFHLPPSKSQSRHPRLPPPSCPPSIRRGVRCVQALSKVTGDIVFEQGFADRFGPGEMRGMVVDVGAPSRYHPLVWVYSNKYGAANAGHELLQ